MKFLSQRAKERWANKLSELQNDEGDSDNPDFTVIKDETYQLLINIPNNDLLQRIEFLKENSEVLYKCAAGSLMTELVEQAIDFKKLSRNLASQACISCLVLLRMVKDVENTSEFFNQLKNPHHHERGIYAYQVRILCEAVNQYVVLWKTTGLVTQDFYVPIAEGKTYIDTQLDGDAAVGDLLTLCELGGNQIGCKTCKEHLMAKYSPVLVNRVLGHFSRCMERRKSKRTTEVSTEFYFDDQTVILNSFIVEEALIMFVSSTDFKLIDQVTAIMVYLISVLREPSGYRLPLSQIELRPTTTGLKTLEMEFKPLTESTTNNACWRYLFAGKVIFKEPVKKVDSSSVEGDGDVVIKDLHASIEVVSVLAGVETEIFMDEGLCLSGLYSLLIPVERILTKDGGYHIKWHFMTVERDSHGIQNRRSRRHLMNKFLDWKLNKCPNWFRTDKIKDLLDPAIEHSFGWTGEARLTLGACDSTYRIHRTTAEIASQEILETTINYGLSIGYGGPGLTFGQSFKIGKGERSMHMDADQNVLDLLESSARELTLLYNPDEKQAWIVPEISVVLHATLAHLYSRPDFHEQGDNDPGVQRLCERLHSPEDPLKALTENLSASLRFDPDDRRQLKHVVKSMLLMLGQMGMSNSPLGNSRKFTGFEFYDLVHQPNVSMSKKPMHHSTSLVLAVWPDGIGS